MTHALADIEWSPHPEVGRRKESAKAVIRSLLALGDVLHPKHRRRFLSNCLWQISEAEGRSKYDLRFRSRDSLTAPRRVWRHEHVYRRKPMVLELINRPDEIENIVAR